MDNQLLLAFLKATLQQLLQRQFSRPQRLLQRRHRLPLTTTAMPDTTSEQQNRSETGNTTTSGGSRRRLTMKSNHADAESATCTTCSSGKFGFLAGRTTEAEACTMTTCSKGYYCPTNGNVAIPCPAGRFNESALMLSACKACPEGKWGTVIGAKVNQTAVLKHVPWSPIWKGILLEKEVWLPHWYTS